MPDLPHEVAELRRDIDAALAAELPERLARTRAVASELDPLADELAAMVRAGGKRLRPVLLLLGHRAAGGDPADVHGPALALELLHTCALLHDDVVDDAPSRRGRDTTHARFAALHDREGWRGEPRRFGEGVAVLLGDLALVVADELFLDAAVPPERLLAGMRRFGVLREEVMAGQALDLLAAAQGRGDRDLALRVARIKSGRYSVARPLQIGAALGGGPDRLLEGLWAYGEPLGVAFQLRDDVLGVFGDAAQTGKSVSSDLAEGKRTLLVVEALERLGRDGARHLEAGLGDRSLDADATAELRGLIRRSGALEAVEDRIEELVGEARAAAAGLEVDGEVRASLRALADFVGRRRG